MGLGCFGTDGGAGEGLELTPRGWKSQFLLWEQQRIWGKKRAELQSKPSPHGQAELREKSPIWSLQTEPGRAAEPGGTVSAWDFLWKNTRIHRKAMK